MALAWPLSMPLVGLAQQSLPWDAELTRAINAYTGGAPVREGKLRLEVAPLVDNGNTVPVRVEVNHPMTAADYVQEIVIFNERNPQRDVVRAQLSPQLGRAVLATRIRLATSQHLVALARLSDGSYWSHSVEVVVTLAACIEEPL